MVTTACTPTAAARSMIALHARGVRGAAGVEVGVGVDQRGRAAPGPGAVAGRFGTHRQHNKVKAQMSEPYYITTAIAYPNGDPHVGHAYEYIATDAIARFKRLDGFDVRFLTGTDVHGQKMAETAAAEGIPTAELARRNSDVFQRMQEKLNISFDRFIRTSDADHYEASKEIWRRMNDAGDIYLDSYSGWYSVRDERFFTEAETSVAPTAPGSPPRRAPR